MTTDTPRADACTHCGAFLLTHHTIAYCEERMTRQKAEAESESRRQSLVKMIHQNNKLEAEVERLKKALESL